MGLVQMLARVQSVVRGTRLSVTVWYGGIGFLLLCGKGD